MSQRNLYLTSAESREIVDVYQSKARAQMSKLYVERMILHPMKFRVTFVQTPFPRKGSMNVTLQSTFMNVITSLAGIEKMELKVRTMAQSLLYNCCCSTDVLTITSLLPFIPNTS